MEQLTIFDILKKPAKKKALLEPNIIPDTDGEYKILLGVRYSMTEVEGWIPAYYLMVYRPPHHYPVLPRNQTVWVDPSTIRSIYCSKSDLPFYAGMAWGFGPRHKIDRHNYECISFDFRNLDDYDRVWKMRYGGM